MKKLMTIIFFAVSASAMAEWIKWSESPNGDESFVNMEQIIVQGYIRIFTDRKKYHKPTKSGEQSVENRYELDCHNQFYKVLQVSGFTDDSWKTLKFMLDPEDDGRPIRPDTAVELLADIICQN